MPAPLANVRYLVDDVEEAVAFYVEQLGFELHRHVPPAFADVRHGALRLLLSGPESSGGRAMADGAMPVAGGWNRVQLVVEDLAAEVEALRARGVRFRNEAISGPGGAQILVLDPAGNLVELFQPAGRVQGGVQ